MVMIGLADPPDTWDAETAKPGAGNTGLAAMPEGVDITADVGRHEGIEPFKDGCGARSRQGRSWPVRVRPQKWRA
jgi:hypothetical protein